MDVVFVKPSGRRYRSLLHRPDGVQVAFEGGAFNVVGGPARELPHDLAHLVVERALALRQGVWGVLAAGGMFTHATVVAGRRAPHATAHGRAVIARAGDRIMQAEILTRAVCDLAADGGRPDPGALRRAVGERWWTDAATRDALARAVDELRDRAVRWAALAPDATLAEDWPPELVAEAPVSGSRAPRSRSPRRAGRRAGRR
jgi:hypothetical protein